MPPKDQDNPPPPGTGPMDRLPRDRGGEPLRLSLGCGNLRMDGFKGVDFRPGPAVDIVADLTQHPWEFAEPDSVSEIRAWHVLEHLPGEELDLVMHEIHRILEPGGRLNIRVPYGIKSLYNPHHFHAFDRRTFDAWVAGRTGGTSLQVSALFRRERQAVIRKWGFPAWHLQRYAPRLSRALFKPDEGAGTVFLFPLTGLRELREWFVKV